MVAEVRERLAEFVASGTDVVLNHGLWCGSRGPRGVEEAGHRGGWRLLYFPVPKDELLRCLAERNEREEAKVPT
ncbi:hypothetical protein ACF9IK_29850 [Kitasatospora hibisci]|uniref:hypothetical protein n=1 Tax=Kitasatospora hibisci TaxID=3369522 RepID=UPI0037545285